MLELLIFFILFIIFFIYLFKFLSYKLEKFEQQIYFLNNNELLNILLENKDNYYNSFYKNDYISRKIKSINEYYENIEKSVYNFSDDQKNKIQEAIKIIEENIKSKCNNLEYFDINKFNEIPWKFGCVTGKLYENGLPHTRDDIIVLSYQDLNIYSNTKLQKTLLHEKIHIYQKKNPDDTIKFLNINNFVKYKKRAEDDNIRANPDLDNWIYQNKENQILKASYNSNPKSIEDIIYEPLNNQSYEHPFEKMAIDFENYI